MKKNEYPEDDMSDYIFSDEELDLTDDEFGESEGSLYARRGIEDYFERREMESLDDWLDEL